jgi:hypothetical protein
MFDRSTTAEDITDRLELINIPAGLPELHGNKVGQHGESIPRPATGPLGP